jgi:hypothetical protein
MKKILLILVLVCTFKNLFSQSLDTEFKYINSEIQSGKLNTDQVKNLGVKWNLFTKRFRYPELPLNKITGEVDFSDTLFFEDKKKDIIYERSLEWIAINYGSILHKDTESGKIIANGNINISHTADYRGSFNTPAEYKTVTSANYAMVLTIKDNKLKYDILNIEYTFTDNYGTSYTLPINSLFPVISNDEFQWKKYLTVLNESKKILYISLKNSLTDYINKVDEDYNF